jgi:hypothetical protein
MQERRSCQGEKKKGKREENSLATLLITLVSLGGFVLI